MMAQRQLITESVKRSKVALVDLVSMADWQEESQKKFYLKSRRAHRNNVEESALITWTKHYT